MEILKKIDYKWLVIIILTLAGVLFAYQNVEKRDLLVSVTDNAVLTPVSDLDSIEFIYNEEQLPNIISTQIRLKNNGNQPIILNDFVSPLKIIFPTDSRIIDFSIERVQPARELPLIQEEYLSRSGTSSVSFTSPLFNQGEIFDIRIISTRENLATEGAYENGEIKYEFNIYGISKLNSVEEIKTNLVKQSEARNNLISIALIFGLLFVGILVLSVMVWYLHKKNPERYKSNLSETKREKREMDFGDYLGLLLLIMMVLLLAHQIVTGIYFGFFVEV